MRTNCSQGYSLPTTKPSQKKKRNARPHRPPFPRRVLCARARDRDAPKQHPLVVQHDHLVDERQRGPQFNIFIFKEDTFNNRFAIANNVPVANHSITFELPSIPVDSGYVYQFTNITDDNDVYAKSAAFPVAAACDSGCDSTSSVAASGSGTRTSGSGASSTGSSSTSSGSAASQTDGAASLHFSAALSVAAAGLLAWITL
ncbi:hypothetical protein CPB85DRAFT_1433081 [Mucidula mucida]|nr:hypothetical protein CPB85DRAFT_1433081 [Mucidula mucida]